MSNPKPHLSKHVQLIFYKQIEYCKAGWIGTGGWIGTVMKKVFWAVKSTSIYLSNVLWFLIIEGLFVPFNFHHIKFNYSEYSGWGKAMINSTFYQKIMYLVKTFSVHTKL